MINCDSFEKIASRHLEYWNLENHDRPLLDLTAPMPGRPYEAPKFSGTLRERWLDPEYMLKSTRARLAATFFTGEAYPSAYPNLGPDIFGAYFGCELDFGEETSWAVNHFGDIGQLDASRLDPDNFWWKKTVELTEIMACGPRGDLRGGRDRHPPRDGRAGVDALPEALCFDLYEEGYTVKRLTLTCSTALRSFRPPERNPRAPTKGATNLMGVYTRTLVRDLLRHQGHAFRGHDGGIRLPNWRWNFRPGTFVFHLDAPARSGIWIGFWRSRLSRASNGCTARASPALPTGSTCSGAFKAPGR
jgi:hypothetical protein